MTLRSMWVNFVAIIGRGLAFSRDLGQVRPEGAGAGWGDASAVRRVWALTETKKSRGWLVGLALVALALVVSLVLA